MVFRYRSINKNTIISILDKSIWMSNPKEFNDPFDSYVEIRYEGTTEEWIHFLEGRGTKMEETLKQELVELAKTDPNELGKVFPRDSERRFKFRDYMVVCCFSATRDNILLWAHYSDNQNQR